MEGLELAMNIAGTANVVFGAIIVLSLFLALGNRTDKDPKFESTLNWYTGMAFMGLIVSLSATAIIWIWSS